MHFHRCHFEKNISPSKHRFGVHEFGIIMQRRLLFQWRRVRVRTPLAFGFFPSQPANHPDMETSHLVSSGPGAGDDVGHLLDLGLGTAEGTELDVHVSRA